MKAALTTMALFAAVTGQAVAQSSPSTATFVKNAALSDMLEIRSSKLVAPNADRDTKPFAQRMIKDHTKTSSQLKSLIQKGAVNAKLPTKLDAEHQAKLNRLQSLSGKRLDAAYDRMQVQAHEQAVSLFTRYARNGQNPALRRWASNTLPKLRHHLSMAQQLR